MDLRTYATEPCRVKIYYLACFRVSGPLFRVPVKCETKCNVVSFRFDRFRFVWFRFVSFGFVSFLFRFALYRYPDLRYQMSILKKTLYQIKAFNFFFLMEFTSWKYLIPFKSYTYKLLKNTCPVLNPSVYNSYKIDHFDYSCDKFMFIWIFLCRR